MKSGEVAWSASGRDKAGAGEFEPLQAFIALEREAGHNLNYGVLL